MAKDHQGEHSAGHATIRSIVPKIGCSGRNPAQLDQGSREQRRCELGPALDERERIEALEREIRELRQASEILREASAYFAMAEVDRRSRT